MIVENLSVPFDRRVWQECESLTNAGWKVDVVCPKGDGYDEASEEEIDGVNIHRYRLRQAESGTLSYLREYLTAIIKTTAMVVRLGRFATVQVCNPPDLLFLTTLYCRSRGAVVVFDHHDLVPELYISKYGHTCNLELRLLRLFERLTFQYADIVISTNESYRKVAVDRGGVPASRVFVVRSAPRQGRFTNERRPYWLADANTELSQIVYLGVMGSQDGVDHAIEALAHLDRELHYTAWAATFVGGGEQLESMKELAVRRGIAEKIRFTGRIPDSELSGILHNAHVALAPDPKNALNDVSTMNKIVEYMAVGLPIVSYDLTESRFSADEAAIYADADDTHDFASRILQLLSDPNERQRRGAIGRERVGGALSWEQSEKQLLRAYSAAADISAQRQKS